MKRLVQASLLLCLLFAAALVINKRQFRYDWENAFWRTMLMPLAGTTWPERFSEAAFAKIQVGMYEQEVMDLIGKPLHSSCNEAGCSWSYTDQSSDNLPYDRRWVFFDGKNRVSNIRHEFYID